jgi:two-component system response regulator AlgR
MALDILIVDDETLARQRLMSLLADCPAARGGHHAEAPDAATALGCIRQRRFALVLLDIHMPGTDGMALAAALRALPEAPAIVFVTAHAGHAVDAFSLDAVDYLTKPVRLERLQQALQKVERIAQSNKALEPHLTHDFLLIQDRGRSERVPLSEVLYLKAELKYLTVRTAAHSYIFDGALQDLEERYAPRFLRVHRNAIVARSAMRALIRHHDAVEGETWAVRLEGVQEPLMVSRRQLAAVREALNGRG